jgi:hypothetical protein
VARTAGRDQRVVDAMWAAWLRGRGSDLLPQLVAWAVPASGADRALSQLALGQGDPAEPVFRGGTARSAPPGCHPAAGLARQRILGDPGLIEEACAIALAAPGSPIADFCHEHQLAPADPPTRAVYFLLTGQLPQYRALPNWRSGRWPRPPRPAGWPSPASGCCSTPAANRWADTLVPRSGPTGLAVGDRQRLLASPSGEWAVVAAGHQLDLYRIEPAPGSPNSPAGHRPRPARPTCGGW